MDDFRAKVEAKYQIIEQLKETTKKALKVGIAHLIGLGAFSGTVSAEEVSEAKQFAQKYESELERMARSEGLSVDADVMFIKKSGTLGGVVIKVANKVDNDQVTIKFFRTRDGRWSKADIKKDAGADNEMNPTFEDFTETIYEGYADRTKS